MFTRSALILCFVLAALTAAGCGQKGPLYVPGVPKESSWPYPEPPKPAPQPRAPDVPPATDNEPKK